MSSIEQAAKRLEELRRAGVELTEAQPAVAESRAGAGAPTPEAVIRALEAHAPAPVSVDSVRKHQRGQARQPPAIVSSSAMRADIRYADIDIHGLAARGFISPNAPQSQLADEFRVIKRPIIRNVLGKDASKTKNRNLVMVTSALPGEGKTFTAVNLAMSVAMEYDNTVLLVDGDVAHPMLPTLLGVPSEPGLLDLLTRDDLDVADALVRTNIDKLSVLPAGSRQRRATELLASEQMVNLLRELATRYSDRIIIFDSPPLLATTEARVLASHMGQIIMVVGADTTSQHAVTQALATIESCEIVLMMLNKARQTDVGSYYGYYTDDGAA
ncbi:MAG: XrtA-associated tyrosine autokinase [Casimicrobiaceae bacterium]